ncbi:hypothetical protein FRC02_000357 [Tulasnella sp. 418]|nr:hypothetical protein FRC02_000357 [Tulasnella sp. 418]
MSQRSRPAPRRKQNSATAPNTDSNVCDLFRASSSKVVKTISNDDDDFFLRNKKPDAFVQDLKLREQAEKEAARLKPIHVVDSDEDESDDVHSSGGKRKRKNAPYAPPSRIKLPEWTKNKHAAKLKPEDSDSDIQIIESDSDSQTKRARSTTVERRGKRIEKPVKKRRSPSVTPPPELTNEDLEPTRELLRATFPMPQRAPSPTFDDTSFDTSLDYMDPELAAIAQRAKLACQNSARSTQDDVLGKPEIVAVTVTYHHEPTVAPLCIARDGQNWTFQIKRNDPFSGTFQKVSNSTGIPLRNLVFIREGDQRIYSHVGPNFVNAWSTVELDAYHEAYWAKILHHRTVGSPTKEQSNMSLPSGTQNSTSAPSRAGSSVPVDDDDDSSFGMSDDLVKISIQGSAGKWPVGARPTTLASVLIGFYLKKAGIQLAEKEWKAKGIKLRYDGDIINYDTPVSEMGDEGLESGDVIDIINV